MLLLFFCQFYLIYSLQDGFVYLHDVDPSILQEIRYQGYHNFIGRPITGYIEPKCILTLQAANSLQYAQQLANRQNLTLKVWDCYRPQKAVDDFYFWSQDFEDTLMKEEFYPYEDKSTLFEKGYIALKSGHSRGSTVDVTLVQLPPASGEDYHPGDKLRRCMDLNRFQDNSIDMGTGFDCFSYISHSDYTNISEISFTNRNKLAKIMSRAGFKPLLTEWWHYTLKNESFPDTYFDFDVE